MADKTEQLISSQRQLLYDVSHELRSPLARMNVALDLLRGRVSGDPAIDRIAIDLQRLNEMIGRLLTVAKLEVAPTLQTAVRVDLSELVSSVVIDANFEAHEVGSRVDIVQIQISPYMEIPLCCEAPSRTFFAMQSGSPRLGRRSK
jgi:two-component system sensor histidine kinase CpxA